MKIYARFERAGTQGKRIFYYRDILKVLQHPYAAQMAGALLRGNALILEEMIDEIRLGNRVFLEQRRADQIGYRDFLREP